MSVLKNLRGTQKDFGVLTKAINLANHTVTICVNENSFPKKYRWILTNQIVQTAFEIATNIRKANKLNPEKSTARYIQRRELQDAADGDCDALLTLIEIAWKVMHLSEQKVEYWTGLVVQVQKAIEGWRESDKKRFGDPESIEQEIEKLKKETAALRKLLSEKEIA